MKLQPTFRIIAIACFFLFTLSAVQSQNFRGFIGGIIFIDDNDNCEYDQGELALDGWNVVATETTSGEMLQGTTGFGGYYEVVFFDPGEYEVVLDPPVDITTSCVNTFLIEIPRSRILPG